MRYLPINLDLQGERCLVVGGGEVAARKVSLLLGAGAAVSIVAPALGATLANLMSRVAIDWRAAPFETSVVAGFRLVIAATDDSSVNRLVAADCEARGILVNVVDDPAHCRFIVPAIIDREEVTVSLSTAGLAPVLATRLRRQLEAMLPPGLGAIAAFMGRHRAAVKAALPDNTARREFWSRFLDSALPAVVLEDPDRAAMTLDSLLQDFAPATARQVEILLESADPLDLTLRTLALLGEAERIVHEAAVPEAILGYARRDAEIRCAPVPFEVPPAAIGLTLYIRITHAPGGTP